ncbi:MAG: hypothetical protein KYX68_14075 [Flavobacterium sp.]|nr:hypothetical protein [Flavobacterium sp.]
MDTEQLLKIIEIQSEIIEILSAEYQNINRSPSEKERMRELLKDLRDAQKSVK